jgi:hypothetical protein
MAGVGKIGIVVALLVLCAPATARFSRHLGSGQAFSLPGWLINVCHGCPSSRGTQRRTPHHPAEPRNAVVEQESRSDFHSNVIRPQAFIAEPVAVPALIYPLIKIDQASPVSDSAFRCVFLI